ncbi:recombination protein RecR [Candidatus Berkelbacteria bacterium]|nr:recombination protein RecR [Candidatus Berkelbacteria bacterium]
MRHLPKSIRSVIDELSKLPGIGPKSAGRLAFYLVRQPRAQSELLGDAVRKLHEHLVTCSVCCTIAESSPCSICTDRTRDQSVIAVVEQPLDTVALEKTDFRGRYHVLGGAVSPIDGIGPENLRIRELIERLQSDLTIKELILATNPSLEGEATALYIRQQIGEAGLTVGLTRIAHGLPVGGDLEYADAVTLTRAMEGRRSFAS